jgi:hypothetical protein
MSVVSFLESRNLLKDYSPTIKIKEPHTDMIKVGLDIHGVIDRYPEFFSFLSATLIDAGHEVHIITGQKFSRELISKLQKLKIFWTKIHSITNFNERRGVKIKYKGLNHPWMDPRAWNSAKARICMEEKIDVHFDDSCVYGKWFVKLKVKTVYIQVK